MFEVLSLDKTVTLTGIVHHPARIKLADYDLVVLNKTFHNLRVNELQVDRGVVIPDRVLMVKCAPDSFRLDTALQRRLADGSRNVRFVPVGQGSHEPFEMEVVRVTPIVEAGVKSAEPRCRGWLHCTLHVDGAVARSFEASEVQRSGDKRALYISRADISDQCFIAEQIRAGRKCELQCVPLATAKS